jgi:maltose O-acetyltransferase
VGDAFFANFNCTMLDVCRIDIGHHVMFGPQVQLYTATHPLKSSERNSGRELGAPIHIGDEVWLGGGVIICPGVRIGNRSTVGAGSVVIRDIPEDVFAAGNPCRVIRNI